MKRYTFESRKWWVMPVEHPDGEWVKFDDAMADRLRVENMYEAMAVENKMREFDEFIEKHNQSVKVFCSDCKHFSMYRFGMAHACMHLDNLKDSWEGSKYIAIATPQERNKNNDCKDWEKK